MDDRFAIGNLLWEQFMQIQSIIYYKQIMVDYVLIVVNIERALTIEKWCVDRTRPCVLHIIR